MKAEDLTGKRFGKLTVIEMAKPIYTSKGERRIQWRCKCECGRERIARASYLKRGQITYCGDCTPPEWLGAKNRMCRYCEFSEWNEERNDWDCSKGEDSSIVKNKCKEFWCAPIDKMYRVKNRQGMCLICGKPVYAHSQNVPLYCYEHRDYAKRDQDIIDKAPKELLFSLIVGIFMRAREDYLTNADAQRSDAEVFLRGEWAQELSVDGFDVEKLFEVLNEEMANESGRTEK